MKIKKISISNFRLLKNFNIDIEDDLTLVIGKNNTGKTSILLTLDKFLNFPDSNKFLIDDFNIDLKNELKSLIIDKPDLTETDYIPLGIRMYITIQYDEKDNLSNIRDVMMSLDPNDTFIVLGFEYVLEYDHYTVLKKDYKEFNTKEKIKEKATKEYNSIDFFEFLKDNLTKYFSSLRKSYEYDKSTNQINYSNSINLTKEGINIKDIINFKFISARRDVTNKEVDKTLSIQTSKIYEKTEASNDQEKAVEDFKVKLNETDKNLSNIYKTLFKEITNKVKLFGGMGLSDTEIDIISTLQHRELLKDNTTVVYKYDEQNKLPENFNGLGYMNLISMIFEIEIQVQFFKRKKNERPADLNLLFIEEPEAHTHPQMQYVFIKNIKKLLEGGIKREDGENRELQYIISTHSSHIVADSDFDDIKYLKKDNNKSVNSKNLKDLAEQYNPTHYQFLKQYLVISRAEVFFADKVILIEGDTERILVPTIMKKLDIEEQKKSTTSGESDKFLPLLSQNISIIEVGAYSHIFDKFIDFLGIKALIITDIDTVDKDEEKCEVAVGVDYSNYALKYFFDSKPLVDLTVYTLTNKLLSKSADKWVSDIKGMLCVVYQTSEAGYHARSFEDAFISLNRKFISDNKDNFRGLKNRKHFDDMSKNAYFLADNCIKKKTHFALDILYHSNDEFSNWGIPDYIKEGLLWLKQN